jgi:hypothetical protein
MRFLVRRLGFARGEAGAAPGEVLFPARGAHADDEGAVRMAAAPPGAVAGRADAPLGVAAPPDFAAPPPVGGLAFGPEQALRQRAALGLDLELPALSVAVGVAGMCGDDALWRRCLASAELALSNVAGNGRVLRLESAGDAGFPVSHNRLMREAFDAGADIYVAASAGGLFHPRCLLAMLRVIAAHAGLALVEAIRFPAEHAKPYDPVTLRTDWACGACLAIPRGVYEAIGGFDEIFSGDCADVDFSWRARALGIPVLIAPNAMFLFGDARLPEAGGRLATMLAAAVLLGRKWGAQAFVEDAERRLREAGWTVPDGAPAAVPDAWRSVADFGHGLDFAALRWQ